MTTVIAVLLIVIFATLGAAKLAAAPPMRAAAAHLGFTTAQYRGIGALEIAAAAGIAMGAITAPLGLAAAAGVTLLMVGAASAHLRNGDRVTQAAVPLVLAAVAIAYAVMLVD